MKRNSLILFFILLTFFSKAQESRDLKMDWAGLARETGYNPAPDWLLDAKFGIYFHWGVYSVPAFGDEWYPSRMFYKGTREYQHHTETYGPPEKVGYDVFVPMFKAEYFNAKDWVDLFQEAGARFAGPVAEHHDGFVMWDSKITPWNAKLMGPHKDILGELQKEIKGRGMKLVTTFHHSRLLQRYKIGDTKFDHSHYPAIAGLPTMSPNPMLRLLYGNIPAEDFYEPVWFGELKEVIDNYSPDIIWFDSWLDMIPEKYRYQFARYFIEEGKKKGQQPVICRKQDDLPLDVCIENLEKSRKQNIESRLWMTDETISTGSWCYTEGLEIKKAKDLIDVLIDIVSKNGVLMLNISPKADGTIPFEQRDVLKEIGQWLKANGEAIYGTRPWYTYGEGPTVQPDGGFEFHQEFLKLKYSPEDVRYTTKGNNIYAITLGVPQAGKDMVFKGFAKGKQKQAPNVKNVSVIGSNQPLRWTLSDEGLRVSVPVIQGRNAVVFKIECK